MARTAWILFGMSISGMIVGIGLVLVFMYTLVVPSIARYRHVWDQCLVLNISEKHIYTSYEHTEGALLMRQDKNPFNMSEAAALKYQNASPLLIENMTNVLIFDERRLNLDSGNITLSTKPKCVVVRLLLIEQYIPSQYIKP